MGWNPYNAVDNVSNLVIGSKVTAYIDADFYLSYRVTLLVVLDAYRDRPGDRDAMRLIVGKNHRRATAGRNAGGQTQCGEKRAHRCAGSFLQSCDDVLFHGFTFHFSGLGRGLGFGTRLFPRPLGLIPHIGQSRKLRNL